MSNPRALLEQVAAGEVSVDEALAYFGREPVEDLGFARLDTHREIRTGAGEVVYCEGKNDDQLVEIFKHLYAASGRVLGTRASAKQAELVLDAVPTAIYDEVSRTIVCIAPNAQIELKGSVAIAAAGTSDIYAAKEAQVTAEFFGARTTSLFDVGVAGIHRLLAHAQELQAANCVVAAAGMEGALASVIAGLVSVPVIGLPTSVGYGANFGGMSALLSMINSCANGVSVVNIDNGFGAGYIAAQINRLSVEGTARN
jgi:hypothetical protein